MPTPPATPRPETLCPAAALVLAIFADDAAALLARLTPTLEAATRRASRAPAAF